MEFIDRVCLDAIPWLERPAHERRSIILQVTEALLCLKELRGCRPGPVGRAIPKGGLLTIYGAGRIFETAADMKPWFNHKLGIIGAGNVTGMFKDLVMCHMDIALRNFILDKAGRLWFLDWATSGFFPRAFEKASLLHKQAGGPDFEFAQDILHEFGDESCDEQLISLLLSVCQVNHGPFQASHIAWGFEECAAGLQT